MQPLHLIFFSITAEMENKCLKYQKAIQISKPLYI